MADMKVQIGLKIDNKKLCEALPLIGTFFENILSKH